MLPRSCDEMNLRDCDRVTKEVEVERERKRRQQCIFPFFSNVLFSFASLVFFFFKIMLLLNIMWIALSLSECHRFQCIYLRMCFMKSRIEMRPHSLWFFCRISAHGNRFCFFFVVVRFLALIHWVLVIWSFYICGRYIHNTSRRFVFAIARHHWLNYVYTAQHNTHSCVRWKCFCYHFARQLWTKRAVEQTNCYSVFAEIVVLTIFVPTNPIQFIWIISLDWWMVFFLAGI